MTISWQGLISRHARKLGWLFAIYWLAMFLATHVDLPKLDGAPQHSDKLAHLLIYGGFGFLLSLWQSALKPWNKRLVQVVLIWAVVCATLDELLQIPIESRSADVFDFLMDVIGAILGVAIFSAVRFRFPQLWQTEAAT